MAEESGCAVRAAILDLVAERGPGKTICPSEAARRVEPEDWRKLMPFVRQEALLLSAAGDIAIYRKGKPVTSDTFKGVYRLGLPHTGKDNHHGS